MTNDFTVSGYVELTAQIHCSGCNRKVHFRTSLPPESVRTGNTTERAAYHYNDIEHRACVEAGRRGWTVFDGKTECAHCRAVRTDPLP